MSTCPPHPRMPVRRPYSPRPGSAPWCRCVVPGALSFFLILDGAWFFVLGAFVTNKTRSKGLQKSSYYNPRSLFLLNLVFGLIYVNRKI